MNIFTLEEIEQIRKMKNAQMFLRALKLKYLESKVKRNNTTIDVFKELNDIRNILLLISMELSDVFKPLSVVSKDSGSDGTPGPDA